ncbi:MAG: hypothetical protein L0Y72_02115 [Gemmataceae bacterium]|nr:hypothetical protein [Gemmataceae bacterium]
MGTWTVAEEIHQPAREVCWTASGGSRFALFTLALAPNPEEAGVQFVNRLASDDDGQPWVQFVEEGVGEFVEQRRREGKPIGRLCVSLLDLAVHPIDSKPRAYRVAAVKAMQQAFESYGVEVE